jgi:SAM-dependent methyltransferase
VNTTLKRRADVREAVIEALRLHLPPHADPPKTWDSLGALYEILTRTTADAKILDAGAEMYSCLLPWLQLCGYQHLRGINLVFDEQNPVVKGAIVYEHGDLTRTNYPDGEFDVVTCLSVVEHGVDWERYFLEMRRILRPGGLLFTSTDYYEDPVETRGQNAFGVPIRVFTRSEMQAAFKIARTIGFDLTGEPDLACEEKAVTWKQYDLAYTFFAFSMTRRPDARISSHS